MSTTSRTGKPPKLRVIGVTVNGESAEKPLKEFSVDEQQYFRALHKIIDDIFAEAESAYGWNWSTLASNAGLTYFTVAKLGDRMTRWPRFMTVYRLAKAVGWELGLSQSKNAVKVSKTKLKAG